MKLSPILSDRKSGGSELPPKNNTGDTHFLFKNECPQGHLRCLVKAIDKTQQLLVKETTFQNYEQIHSAKSILYAAVEQMGMKAERLFSAQRMLRELLSIVSSQYASPGHDKQVGLQLLDELKQRISHL